MKAETDKVIDFDEQHPMVGGVGYEEASPGELVDELTKAVLGNEVAGYDVMLMKVVNRLRKDTDGIPEFSRTLKTSGIRLKTWIAEEDLENNHNKYQCLEIDAPVGRKELKDAEPGDVKIVTAMYRAKKTKEPYELVRVFMKPEVGINNVREVMANIVETAVRTSNYLGAHRAEEVKQIDKQYSQVLKG